MMKSLSLDFETKSVVDLRRTGVYPYAAHPLTDILCMAWALSDDEIPAWVPGMSPPEEIVAHVEDGGEIRAWNAQFERIIWWMILTPRYGFPRPSREQFVDTAAEAAAMALPRGLEDAARVLNLPVEKDMEGRRLMLQMTKPRKPRKGEPKDALLWWDADAEKLERLIAYCQQDVRVEREVAKRLRPLGDFERKVYLLDQVMNDRGVPLDRDLIQASQLITTIGLAEANAEIDQLTAGAVTSVTKAADLTRWLQSEGAEVENVRKDTIRDLLADGGDELDDTVRRVAEIRSESAKSSTAKLVSMLKVISRDDRARGLLLYHGASTGRWAGKLIQPQNFPRGEVKKAERFIPRVLACDYGGIAAEEPPLMVVSSLLRAMIRASEGHQLMAGDFGQIEARVVAWIAGQEDLVQLFASGGKIYETMAAEIYGVPVDEIPNPSEKRQIGKNTVLGCGFGMGEDTFVAQVKKQTGIDLPPEVGHAAVQAFRTRFSKIRKFWSSIDRAAIQAVQHPGKAYAVGRGGRTRFVVRGQFLWCVLPSGRPLAYALPRVVDRTLPWDRSQTRPAVTFMSVNGYTRKWSRTVGYGGLWTENVVQAMARDLIAAAMARLESAGYRPILTVHDEVVAEPELGHGSLDEFLELMTRRPRWAEGLPVAAEGWTGPRYRK